MQTEFLVCVSYLFKYQLFLNSKLSKSHFLKCFAYEIVCTYANHLHTELVNSTVVDTLILGLSHKQRLSFSLYKQAGSKICFKVFRSAATS